MTISGPFAIASRNPGKVREIRQIFGDLEIDWITDDAGDWPEVEETGETYLANALLKAGAIAAHLGSPVLADDSGIEVDALEGEPGVRSARFAGESASDEENLNLLIHAIRAVAPAKRTARYRCVAVAAWPDGREVHVEATCEGTLITEPRGSGGFGYDPIFLPADDSTARTMAELTPEQKDAISHRGRAFRALHARLAP